MNRLLLPLVTALTATVPFGAPLAATPEPENPEVIVVPSGEGMLLWQGQPGRTYFIQCSDPNFPLLDWVWMHLIESGSGVEISHEIVTTADRAFFRLWHTDEPPPPGVSLEDWDTDGDGLSNRVELEEWGSNPLLADTSGDGVPDGWAAAHGHHPLSSIGASLFQGGPLTNLQAYAAGVQARPAATLADLDGDGIPNDLDADPHDPDVDWERSGVGDYVLIDLGWPDGLQSPNHENINDFNATGHVLLDRHVWRLGQWHSIPVGQASGSETVGETETVSYQSIDNTGFRLTPSGGILHWGTWQENVPGNLGSIPYPYHLGHQTYDAESSTYGPFVSTLSTHGLMIDQGLVVLRPLGGDASGRIFADKSLTWVSNDEIWIYDTSLQKTGALALPEDFHVAGSVAALRRTTVTPSGWLAYVATSSHPATGDRALVWNPEGQPATGDDGLLPNFSGFTELPHGKPALSYASQGENGTVYLLNQPGGGFDTAANLSGKNIHTFAGDGTAMTTDGRMWINGELIPIRDLCPAYGDLLDDGWTFLIHKANPRGTYLIHTHNADESTNKPMLLVPVELYSDFNNDGEVNSADSALVGKPYASGASEEEKDKGTEFMFANDNLSNGAWDKEDPATPKPGQPGYDEDKHGVDDDAEPIFVGIGSLPDETQVWLDHPASAGLKYYRDRKCTEEIPLSSGQPHVVGGSVEWPDDNIVFVRAESVNFPDAANPQVEGDLKLMVKLGGADNGIEATKMKLTVVKEFGAKKYFLAARDYIFENNTRLFVKDIKYSASTFRVCTICEELSTLSPIETYHDDPTPDPERKGPRGIRQAITTHSEMTIITNGNMVYFSGDESKWDALGLLVFGAETSMTDKCQGGIVTREHARLNPASTEAGTVLGPGEGVLAQDQAKFIAQQLDGSFLFEKGHLPKNPLPVAAMGGLSTFYDNPARAGADRQFVGYWPRTDNGAAKGCIFTATHTSGNTNVTDLVNDARTSEVPAFEGTRLKMFMLDSGDAAVTLAHSNPDGQLKLIDFQEANILRMQASYQAGVPYFTNTYLAFKTSKPRQ